VEPIPLPPRVDTERLAMRPWRTEDVESLHEALGESVAHLLPWVPWATSHAPTLEEAERLLGGWIEQRASGKNFIYAMFERAGGRLVGGIGLYARVGAGRLEVGYWLRRTASGVGYATEATSAVADAGFGVAGVTCLEIHTDPDNLASRRIPEKLGYRLAETRLADEVRGGDTRDTVIYTLERTS
jgi:RimJ/RimL family protein N-acetyltransferase